MRLDSINQINSLPPPTVCGCRIHFAEDFAKKLHPPAPDCAFCDGTGILKRTEPETATLKIGVNREETEDLIEIEIPR